MEKKKNYILNHSVLQTLACTLKEYEYRGLRTLYEAYLLHVTPIENTARIWIDEKLVLGDLPRRISYYNKVCINPARWADVMQTVTPKDLEVLLEKSKDCGQVVSTFLQYFLKAFCCAMHGQPFEDDLKQVPWPILTSQMPGVKLILKGLSHRQDCMVFMQHLPGSVLQGIYYHEYVCEWAKLKQTPGMDVVRQLFVDNQFVEESRRQLMRDAYLYNVEFLQTGKLSEVIGKMEPEGEYCRKMSALQKLHEGDTAGALELLQALLKESDTDFFEEALTNFAYGVSLGLSIAAPSTGRVAIGLRKKAETLLRSRKAAAMDCCYILRLVLHHYVTGDAEKFYEQNPIQDCHDKMCWRLSTLFVRHYQIQQKEMPEVSAAVDYVIHEDSGYLRLLYSFDYDQLQSSADQLQKETGLTASLLPKVKRKAKWERTMEELLKLNQPSPTPGIGTEHQPSLEVERVAYMVNLRNKNIQPKLQK